MILYALAYLSRNHSSYEKYEGSPHFYKWGRMSQDGWTYGETKDSEKKKTPCLVPYDELSEIDKDYDRNTAMETLKLIIKLGFEIKKKD